jgi:hypothetical protein
MGCRGPIAGDDGAAESECDNQTEATSRGDPGWRFPDHFDHSLGIPPPTTPSRGEELERLSVEFVQADHGTEHLRRFEVEDHDLVAGHAE